MSDPIPPGQEVREHLVVAPAHYDGSAAWDFIEESVEQIHNHLIYARFRPDFQILDLDRKRFRKMPAGVAWNLGTAIKYLWRAGNKPGDSAAQDLAKARQYIGRTLIDPRPEEIEVVLSALMRAVEDRKRLLTPPPPKSG
jgi:hypothetical protein